MRVSKRTFERGICEECANSFLKKPATKRFCKSTCRDRFNNRRRLNLSPDQMMTISEAAKLTGKDYEQVRRLVRAGKLRSQRIFGRIVVYKADITTLEKGKNEHK